MSDTIGLSIFDIRHGWAKCRLTSGEKQFEFTFGYCTDAFADLAWGALSAAVGQHAFALVMDDEPTGWFWDFRRDLDWARDGRRWEPTVLILSLWQTPSSSETGIRMMNGGDPRLGGNKRFEARIDESQFAQAMLSEFERIEREMGMAAFEAAWMQPYPSRAIAALRTALATEARSQPQEDTENSSSIMIRHSQSGQQDA